MTRTSARIEFIEFTNRQNNISCIGRYCCPAFNYIEVDRTFPQILEYYKTVDEWTEICEKFDRAFIPMKTASKSLICEDQTTWAQLVIGVFFTVIAAILLRSFMLLLVALIGLAIVAVTIVHMLCMIVFNLFAWRKVKNSLRKSCGRESKINEVVSFYLRQENSLFRRKYYIECIIGITNNANASDVVESGMNLASSIPVATVVNDGSVYNGAVVTSAPVASAPDVIVPFASAQVDVGVDSSAEDWNDQN